MSETSIPPEVPEQSPADRNVLLEASIVAAVTVGFMLVRAWFRGAAATTALAFTDTHLYSLVAYEVVVAGLAVPILLRRGWQPRVIAGAPTPRDVLRGLGLLFAVYALTTIVWLGFVSIDPGDATRVAAAANFPGKPAGPPAIVLGSVINAVFEEMLWLGYFIQRLGPRLGWGGAATISVALRLAVHLYQGALAFVVVLPVAILFTCYYAATRRVWPAIVAHVCLDALSLAMRYNGR